jgi:hypothetical protein
VTKLIKELDAATAKNADAKMGSFFVFLSRGGGRPDTPSRNQRHSGEALGTNSRGDSRSDAGEG